MSSSFEKELQVTIDAAHKAAKSILDARTQLQISFKTDTREIVTNADIQANLLIENELKTHFNDVVISEETASSHQFSLQHKRIWFVDPIDGTLAFSQSSDEFCTMIGLCIDAKPVFGLVYKPSTNEYWYGIKNQGAFFVQKNKSIAMDLKKYQPANSKPRILLSKSRTSSLIFQQAKRISPFVKKMSSAGLKITQIAQGEADFYLMPYQQIMLWDLCAPAIILQESGGIIEHSNHEAISFNANLALDHWLYAAHPAWAHLAQNFVQS